MKKWFVVLILGAAQFVMVLDGTVMNVSISTVVEDLDSTVTAMQTAITFYTLTMAALMLLGAKLGDIWGRRRALVIGSIIYAIGSGTTALAPSMGVLFLGWSIIEGLGAVLVIPAVAALIADNYEGRDRITAFAVIGAVSGAAVAAGPLIGGFLTTYASWRVVFAAEVVIMIFVVIFARRIGEKSERRKIRIDVLSVILSALGLDRRRVRDAAEQGLGLDRAAPLPRDQRSGDRRRSGISLHRMVHRRSGLVLLVLFFRRQRTLVEKGREPLLHVEPAVDRPAAQRPERARRAVRDHGRAVLHDARLPADDAGTRRAADRHPHLPAVGLAHPLLGHRHPAVGALVAAPDRASSRSGSWSRAPIVLLGAVDPELSGWIFGIGMFAAGAALGLLASQLGNVNMSAVTEKDTSEVGGLQGVFQNLGSSLGTALIGSILIGALATSFASGVAASALPDEVQTIVSEATAEGVDIIPAASVPQIAEDAGLSEDEGTELTAVYTDSQLEALRIAFFGLIALALLSLLASRGIPDEVPLRKPEAR